MRHVPNAPKRRKLLSRKHDNKPAKRLCPCGHPATAAPGFCISPGCDQQPRGLARLSKGQRAALEPIFREHLTLLLRAVAEEYAIHESTKPERYARPARGLLAGVEQALRRYIAEIDAIVEPADAGREAA